jgi:hypothetical protein
MSEERRTYERFKVDFPVKFKALDSDIEGAGNMIDISAGGGGMIVTDIKLENSAALQMWLFPAGYKEALAVAGVVVWSATVKQNVFRVGVQFDPESLDFLSFSKMLTDSHKKENTL